MRKIYLHKRFDSFQKLHNTIKIQKLHNTIKIL